MPMTVDQVRAELQRSGFWVLEVDVDRCTLENAVPPCLALTPCRFTWTTCTYVAAYTRGVRTYRFCSPGAQVSGAMPLLQDDITFLTTKIDEGRFTTEKGEMRFVINNDDPLLLDDPEKMTSQLEDLTLPGRFLERLLARSPNLHGRPVRLYRGYYEVAEVNWELKYQGKIEEITWDERGVELRTVDLLYKLGDAKVPAKISSTNTLTVIYSGGATLSVVDVSEFTDASVNEPQTVKVDNEYVLYTGKNTGLNQLTGCTAGAYGTTSVAHSVGTEVEQVLIYANLPFTQGLTGDHIITDLLCKYGSIPASSLDVVDYGLSLVGVLGLGAVSAVLNNTTALPGMGIIQIDAELIWFAANNRTTNTLSGLKRGMYGTADAAHLGATPVYLSRLTEQLSSWFYAPLFRIQIESPQSVKSIIQNIQESSMLSLWQTELAIIKALLQAPALPGSTTTPPTLTLTRMEYNSRDIDRNEEDRYTRVSIYYNPSKAWPGTSPEDYASLTVDIGASEENVNYYGEVKEKVIYSKCLYRASDALWLALHLLSKYRNENPIVGFNLELYDEALQVGDPVYLQVPEIVLPSGDYSVRLYRIIWKKPIGINKLEFKVHDTGFGLNRYSLIGPLQPKLDQLMTNVQVTMNVDLTASPPLVFADFASGALHALTIMNAVGSPEVITYTGATNLGGGKVQFTGLTRDADGALGGGVAHAAGEMVLLMYSAMTDLFIDRYGFQGTDPGNLLDRDADFVDDVVGYKIW